MEVNHSLIMQELVLNFIEQSLIKIEPIPLLLHTKMLIPLILINTIRICTAIRIKHIHHTSTQIQKQRNLPMQFQMLKRSTLPIIFRLTIPKTTFPFAKQTNTKVMRYLFAIIACF